MRAMKPERYRRAYVAALENEIDEIVCAACRLAAVGDDVPGRHRWPRREIVDSRERKKGQPVVRGVETPGWHHDAALALRELHRMRNELCQNMKRRIENHVGRRRRDLHKIALAAELAKTSIDDIGPDRRETRGDRRLDDAAEAATRIIDRTLECLGLEESDVDPGRFYVVAILLRLPGLRLERVCFLASMQMPLRVACWFS